MQVIHKRLEDTERRLQLYQEVARSFMQDAEFWRIRAEAFQAYICRNGWDLPDFAIATNPEEIYTETVQEIERQSKCEQTKQADPHPLYQAGKPW